MNARVVAVHEAAHGCAALLAGWPVQTISIVPSQHSAGYCAPAVKPDDRDPFDWLPYLLAGGAAERKLTGRPAVGDRHDLEIAHALVAVTLNTSRDDRRVARELAEAALIADHRVRQHWRWIERTARALLRQRTLTGREIAGLYDVND